MTVSLHDARTITDAAIAKAEQIGLRVSVAVMDEGGRIISVVRMDGAGFLSPEIALGKAFASAAFKRESAKVEALAETKPALFSGLSVATQGRFLPGRGGLPLVRGDQFVGAVGVSGARAEQDEEVAQAAVDAFGRVL